MADEVEKEVGRPIDRKRLFCQAVSEIPEIAYHEAGHAVVRYVFGFYVERLELARLGEDCEHRARIHTPVDPAGALRLLPYAEPMASSGLDTPTCLNVYWRSLVHYIAGPVAQNRYLVQSSPNGHGRWQSWEDWCVRVADDLPECLPVLFRIALPETVYESGSIDPFGAIWHLLWTEDGAQMRDYLALAFETASDLVERCWRAVDEMAKKAMAADEGTLMGDDVERVCQENIPRDLLDAVSQMRAELDTAVTESKGALVSRVSLANHAEFSSP
jgi:hypothetical protein